jgi:hypothetical protein
MNILSKNTNLNLNFKNVLCVFYRKLVEMFLTYSVVSSFLNTSLPLGGEHWSLGSSKKS